MHDIFSSYTRLNKWHCCPILHCGPSLETHRLIFHGSLCSHKIQSRDILVKAYEKAKLFCSLFLSKWTDYQQWKTLVICEHSYVNINLSVNQ